MRYLLLGGAITGGVTLNNKYEEWKTGLPDFKWIDDVLPDTEQWSKFSKSMKSIQDSVIESIDIGWLHFRHTHTLIQRNELNSPDLNSKIINFQILDSNNWAKIKCPNGVIGSIVAWIMPSKQRPRKTIPKSNVSSKLCTELSNQFTKQQFVCFFRNSL